MNELDPLKHRLETERATSERWQSLNMQRDELEAMTEKLSEEIRQEKRSLHRSHSDQLAKNIEKMEGLIYELNQRKRELDHLLDRIEDHSIDNIAAIRAELIQEILRANPSETSTYNSIDEAKNEYHSQLNELNEVSLSLKQIQALLEVVLDERSSVKKRGILRYILGKSPNFIITKCLDTAKELSDDAIKLLNPYPEIRALLEEFLQECSGKWSFKKIDTVFAVTLRQLTTHLANLAEKQALLEQELQETECQLETWLNKW